MLQLASANHIDTLDTAIAYGESESRLGELGTQGFKLVTKLPALPDGCVDIEDWVDEQIAASLNRLRVNAVYGLLLHRPSQLLESDGGALYRSMRRIKDIGRAQKIGISISAPNELEALARPYRFDLIQAPLNLLDHRLQTTGWLRRLKDQGVEVHTRSTFLQGLLLMPQAAIPAKFLPWSELWSEWHGWLLRHHTSAVQACLAFPLSYPEIDRVVVGADNLHQLRQIAEAVAHAPPVELPDLHCDAENLINPACWHNL